MKTFQEIPIDLFDHLIDHFKGQKTTNRVSQFGIIPIAGEKDNNYIIIQKKDYGGCHPSFPYTKLNLFSYKPSIRDFIEKGLQTFDDENDERLKSTIYFTISSSKMSSRFRYYNLLYTDHPKTSNQFQERQFDTVTDYCKKWIHDRLENREYGFNGDGSEIRDLIDMEKDFNIKEKNPDWYEFCSELTHNRYFDMQYDDYKKHVMSK